MADGKAGRPPREFDKRVFENCCHVHCTRNEIEFILHTDARVLEKWCQREYDEDFDTVYKRFSSGGKMSLRRAQFKYALEGNASLLIWLGKQILDQHDSRDDDKGRSSVGVYENITALSKNDRTGTVRKAA